MSLPAQSGETPALRSPAMRDGGWKAFHEPVRSAVVPTAGSDSVPLSSGTPGGTPGVDPQARTPALQRYGSISVGSSKRNRKLLTSRREGHRAAIPDRRSPLPKIKILPYEPVQPLLTVIQAHKQGNILLDRKLSLAYPNFVKKDRLILAEDRLNTKPPTKC